MTRLSLSMMALIASLALVACGADEDGKSYVNIFTGEACSPDPLTLVPMSASQSLSNNGNGNISPTGIPGDNMDDLRSGKIDCLGDGNSGQGDDRKHPWCGGEPPPGCDEEGCCDEDCLDKEPDDEPQADPPQDDPPAEDPPADDPPVDDPPFEDPPA